ncbi:MAG: elongation factor Ts [Vulcanimicrobiaceae bacterium]
MSTETSYKPTTDEIKRLREETGAGIADCRAALVASAGDFAAARKGLIEAGGAKAAKKSERVASEGLVGQYVHVGGKIGVLVEVNCETDFVARNERFSQLVRDVAMHIAAMPVEYVSRDDVPEERLAALRAEFTSGLAPEKRAFAEKIVEGKLGKWFEEHVLLEQPFIKNDERTVGQLVSELVGVLGEKIAVRRFAKFTLGAP